MLISFNIDISNINNIVNINNINANNINTNNIRILDLQAQASSSRESCEGAEGQPPPLQGGFLGYWERV